MLHQTLVFGDQIVKACNRSRGIFYRKVSEGYGT